MNLLAFLFALALPQAGDPACGDQSRVPADERVFNRVRWVTASEEQNFGFDIFRGDSEEGPFIKITERPVLGAGDSDQQNRYAYEDDQIDPCQAYWYYVESISLGGEREKFTPTFRAAPKREP